ncbi:MAG: serine/threonine-protein kinase, partial [Myxococcota bacterium]
MDLHAQPSPAQQCPDEDRFADFVAGSLDDSARAALQGHFDRCARCSDALGLMLGAFDDGTGGSLTGDTNTRPGSPNPLSTLSGRFAERYEILECVGLGAGGTVYSAYDPELERVVALKVLRGGERGEDGSTRPDAKWTREAKTMAKVVHPNVVAVHDVGVADEHVFIATEFVEGGSLEDWFHVADRSWREVAALFVEAGHGLAAIHARGLVHRDFKPHNVLVGKDGRPRVTDFGLARLLPELDDLEDLPTAENFLATIEIGETIATQTRTGMLVGTPAYMSPEQWRGLAADARSDQFSFCVALYQGLWGTRPFRGKSSVELSDRVCEGDLVPVPAGTRVPRWLTRVVLRGLSVAPEDRFASMDALLEAMAAGPKKLRRQWTTAALAVGFVGVAGLGYGLASWDRDTCDRDDARFAGIWDAPARAERAAAWNESSLGDGIATRLDGWVDAWHEVHGGVCRAAASEEKMGARQHELQLACLDRRVAELRAATTVMRTVDAERALDVLATLGSPERCGDPDTLVRIEPTWGSPEARVLATEMAADLARCESLRAVGDFDGSLALAKQLVATADENGDPAVRAEALNQLGLAQSALKQADAATQTLRDAVWAAEASGHVEMATSAWIEIVEVVGGITEDYEEAERAAERADAAAHRLGDPAQIIHLNSSRGLLQSMQGHYDEALRIHSEAIAQAKEVFGPRDPQVARMHMNLAAVLSHLGRHDEALEHAQTGVSIFESEVSPLHPELAEFLNTVGALQLNLQDIPAARVTYRRAVAIAESSLAEDSPVLATLYGNLAHADVAEKNFDAAIAGYEKVLALYRKAHGPEHPEVALALHNLAGAIDDSGDQHRAIEIYREALAIRLATTGPEHPGTANTWHNLGLLEFTVGEVDKGIELMEKARAVRESHNIDPFRRASTR